ncbi:hypothetical protein F5I97DRAFT_943890 [Phlebopus sp. FC_14]|nr:hypothetical protein F5I97DRAFT_943890 [Phlebopus sp. FC_14]
MESADLHDVEFVWYGKPSCLLSVVQISGLRPSTGPTDVIVTGTFDQWSSSIHLAKGDAGFSGIVKIPWDEKIVYKYIVDGYWRCRDDRPSENDGNGNVNNVMHFPPKPEPPTTVAPIPAPTPTDAAATTTSKESTTPSDGPQTGVSPTDDTISVPVQPAMVLSDAHEPDSASKVAPVVPITILPVNDLTTVGSASPSPSPERHSEAVAVPEPPQSDGNDTTQGADSPSAYTPGQFPRLESHASTSAPDPAAGEPSKQEIEPPDLVESSPVTDGVNAGSAPSDVVTDVPPAPPAQQVEEEESQNKASTTPTELSASRSAEPSTPPIAPTSKLSVTTRKKRLSLFGKLKAILFDKDKSKGKKSKN